MGMHKSSEEIISRLRLGMERARQRKEESEAKLKEKYDSYQQKRMEL